LEKKKRRVQRSRSRKPRSAIAVDTAQELREQLGRELFGVCKSVLSRFGVKAPVDISRSARLPSKAVGAGQVLTDAEQISAMFTLWREHEDYIDAHTMPRVISIAGPTPSFAALCDACDAKRKMRRWLSVALNLGMCRRVGADRVALLSNVALYSESPTLLLAYAVKTAERTLRTAAFNIARRRNTVALVQRTAAGFLTEEDFSVFAQMMKHSVANFTEQQHRWMTGHGGDSKERRGKRLCGVTAFVHRD